MAGPNETAFGFALGVMKSLFDALLRSSMISHDSSRSILCISVEIPPTYDDGVSNTNGDRDWPFHDCRLHCKICTADHNDHAELLADVNCWLQVGVAVEFLMCRI